MMDCSCPRCNVMLNTATNVSSKNDKHHIRLIEMIDKNILKSVKILIRHKQNDSALEILQKYYQVGELSCMAAVEAGQKKVLDLFIKLGFPIIPECAITAARDGNLSIFKLLLKKGCAIDRHCCIAAHENNHVQIIDFMMTYKKRDESDIDYEWLQSLIKTIGFSEDDNFELQAGIDVMNAHERTYDLTSENPLTTHRRVVMNETREALDVSEWAQQDSEELPASEQNAYVNFIEKIFGIADDDSQDDFKMD
jgi:hypothetical protein